MNLSTLANIYRLGLKELKSLWADKVLLVLICWAFSGAIYTAATGASQELRHAPIAIVDEDQSPLSRRLVDAFYPPYFRTPQLIALQDLDAGMDSGRYNFTLVIPSRFQRDVEAGKVPDLQLNIDATIMTQAFIGSTYVKSIALGEISEYLTGRRDSSATPIKLTTRVRFNPNLIGYWFGGVMEAINNVTMLTIILVGAAFIREREHGTIEHLLVMPLTTILEEVYHTSPGLANGMIPNDPELPLPLNKVHPIHEVVKVDYFIPGCPPSGDAIWKVLTDLLAGREPELGHGLMHYD